MKTLTLDPHTSPKVLLQCGHTANATDGEGLPVCVICYGIDPGSALPVVEQPDLTGRIAKCYCGKCQPSDIKLPFFEYRGPGSAQATKFCSLCSYSEAAHCGFYTNGKRNPFVCQHFTPAPRAEDSYYCGCDGWD